MNEQELKIQAYFDGELPENEAREVANLLAKDRDAVALLQTLRATRQAVSTFESGIRLPEAREFYWSKIRSQIEREEAPRPEPVSEPLFRRLLRYLLPAAGVAVLVMAGVVATRSVGGAVQAETALADSNAFTYRDYASGTTLVWLSYPAEDTAQDSWTEFEDEI